MRPLYWIQSQRELPEGRTRAACILGHFRRVALKERNGVERVAERETANVVGLTLLNRRAGLIQSAETYVHIGNSMVSIRRWVKPQRLRVAASDSSNRPPIGVSRARTSK